MRAFRSRTFSDSTTPPPWTTGPEGTCASPVCDRPSRQSPTNMIDPMRCPLRGLLHTTTISCHTDKVGSIARKPCILVAPLTLVSLGASMARIEAILPLHLTLRSEQLTSVADLQCQCDWVLTLARPAASSPSLAILLPFFLGIHTELRDRNLRCCMHQASRKWARVVG